MEYNYSKKSDDFSIEIKANINSDEQKNLLDAIGHMATSNMCLLNTKLLNTCLNLIHMYSNELLENLADFTEINDVELDSETKNKLDDFSSINNFKL